MADYAPYLRDMVKRGDLAVSTAQNLISSVNRTMAALRGDQYVKLPSPSKALGMKRSGVRQSVPQGQDREQVNQIVNALCSQHQVRAAAIVLWHELPVCACVRLSWLTCHGLAVRLTI